MIRTGGLLTAIAVAGAAPAAGAAAGEATTLDWLLLWLYLGLALGVSFLCSLLEASILSMTPAFVSMLVSRGRRTGRMLEAMKTNIDRPLSAILTLNTVAHTVGAAGVGAQAAAIFGRQWVGAISAVLTFLILILSEIVPKTIGAVAFKRMAGFTAYTVQGMTLLLWPLVRVCELVSRLISGSTHSGTLTREELESLSHLGHREGVLARDELNVMNNLLALRRTRAKDVMTPRSVTFMLRADTTVGELMERHEPPRFARIPIHRGDPDELIGVVPRFEIMRCYHEGRLETALAELARPLVAVPEHATVADLLERFIGYRAQLFQVVDEYGGTAGIVSLEDAIETLLGAEIVDETDPYTDMRALADLRRRMRFPRDAGETQ